MNRLFLKFFASVWLAVLLLAAALLLAQRLFGQAELQATETRLATHAQTAAVLWAEEDERVLRRWLHGLRRDERLPVVLLDAAGRPPVWQRLPPHVPHRRADDAVPEPGVHHVGRGHYRVVAALPEVDPPLYLVAVIDAGLLPPLPLWGRVLLALLATALVSGLLARLLTRRIAALRATAAALGEGDMSARVQPKGRDELADLAREFNRMAEQLQRLLASHRQLVSDVSHELRSPLARLRVALELAERAADPARALARIGQEADALERLIADLLSLARLESAATLPRVTLDPAELLRQVVQDAAFEAAALGRCVTLDAESGCTIAGDPVLLRSAVENVVRNGVRHTPAGSAVQVSLRRAGAAVRICVLDAGPGVPEADLDCLFEPFTRIEEARDRASGGHGLGLAITARAVRAHGGRVWAENRADGGLAVAIELALADTGPAPAA